METQFNNTLIPSASQAFDRLEDRYERWHSLEPQQCWQDARTWHTYLADGNTTLTVTLDTGTPSTHSDMRLQEAIWQKVLARGWNFTVYNQEPSKRGVIRYVATIVAHDLYLYGAGATKGEAALDAYCKALDKFKEMNK